MGWFRERIKTENEKTSTFSKKNPYQDFVIDEGEFITIKNGVSVGGVEPSEDEEEVGEEDGSAGNRSDISE